MARTRRDSGTRVPSLGGGPTGFAFVTKSMARAFWKEWAAINRRYEALGDPPEGMTHEQHWANVASMRRSARAELRATLRATLVHDAGADMSGLIPIQV